MEQQEKHRTNTDLKFTYKKIKELTPPCYVTICTTWLGFGVTYILMGFDAEKQKYRLKSAKNPYHKERFVAGTQSVIVDVEWRREDGI